MQLKNAIVVYTKPTTREYKSALGVVERALKKYKICHIGVNRDKLGAHQFKNSDLIIAVGGDGTFLRASHFAKGHIMLGVNADVKNKEGFFMKADKRDFEKKLVKIINGGIKIRRLPRLEASINGKRIGTLALNEFFIGPRKSYHAAKYTVQAGGKKERQKSSGILVTTPTGSYAWAKSCCGKTLPIGSRSYQFVVREPYEGKVFKNYRLKYGVLGRNREIIIFSQMLDGILVADSVSREYSFKNGSKAKIRLSNSYLNVVWE